MKQKIYKILLQILRFLTKLYLWRVKPFTIWITWSVWKTSCRTIVSQVLKQLESDKLIYTSPKNYNSELWLIFSIFQIEEYSPSIKSLLLLSFKIFKQSIFSPKKYDILIAEYGIDSPGDMDFLISVLRPDIWIITQLDAVHAGNFPRGVEQYWTDKIKLLVSSKTKCFYNPWDVIVQESLWLLPQPEAYWEKNISSTFLFRDGEFFQEFQYRKKSISINLIGEENVSYTLLSIKLAEYIWYPLSKNEYTFYFQQAPGRFSIYEKSENIFVDSTYNASPKSMHLAIKNTLSIQKKVFPNKKLIFVLWDMRELWDTSETAHEDLVEYVSDSSAIFTVWPEMYQFFIPKLQQAHYKWEVHSSLSSREIAKKLKTYLTNNNISNYIILFKGSQNTIFMEESLLPLLTVSQRKNLVRQSVDWKRKKDIYFKTL